MKTRILFFVLFVAALVAGCDDDDDDYSLGKFWVTTATVEMEDDNAYTLLTDNGDRLFPSATAVPWFDLKNNQRVWVNYTILGDATQNDLDYFVKINNLQELLTKGIITLTAENADSIGHDPVTITNYWFNDDYLTIEFKYGGGGTIHFINLAQDEDHPENEQGQPILEFRHNRNDDPYNTLLRGIVSFDLSELKTEGQNSIDFVLKAKGRDADEDFEEVVTYEW